MKKFMERRMERETRETVCPMCGVTNGRPGVRFCAECGSRLDVYSAAVDSFMSSILRSVPGPVKQEGKV